MTYGNRMKKSSGLKKMGKISPRKRMAMSVKTSGLKKEYKKK